MKYIKLIIIISILFIISYTKSKEQTNKLEKKILTIKKYLKKGGTLAEESNEYDIYDDVYTSDLGYTNIRANMKDSLMDTTNSIDNDIEDIIFDGGNANNDNRIKIYNEELEKQKLDYEKDNIILKQMIKYYINRNDNRIKESYNQIYKEFLNNKEEQKRVYDGLKNKDTKYINKYADELGIDLNKLEDNTKEDEEEKKEEESGIINKVTTFVKSSIDNLFGTDLLDLNNNDINQSDNKKKLNIDEKYDSMVDIYEDKINEELSNKGNDLNMRDTDTNYRSNKLESLNINDLETSSNKFSENDKNGTNNRQLDLEKLYSNNKIISPSENLCSDGIQQNKKRYDKYNGLILDVDNINKKYNEKNNTKKMLEPYNMDEFEEYSCLDVNCDDYKDKHSRVDCVN
tara:strand:+ start:3055 stop:4257 length:1203 start_codon:yes stop_codon:yes gene_type:complete